MIHKINLSLLSLVVGLFATHGIAQQQRRANSLVGTYYTGHRFGSSALTLEANGSYVMRSNGEELRSYRLRRSQQSYEHRAG
jgi:hypothetical protein